MAGHPEGEGVLHCGRRVQGGGSGARVDAVFGGGTPQAQRAHDGVQERLALLSR